MSIAQQAEKMGAVDKISRNLPASVEGANLIVLALPINEIRETLEFISSDLREGVVLMDTAPVKSAVFSWMEEFLPAGCYYIGLTPVLNPAYLLQNKTGLEAAHPDLFQNSLMGIIAAPSANAETIKLATDLTQLLGASPFFVDPAEIDGLMASTHLFPQLLSAALVNITIDQPGWRESRKVAGRAFAEATIPIDHLDEPGSLNTSILENSENMVRILEDAITTLQWMRDEISSGKADNLEKLLANARQGRKKWWAERATGDWLNMEGIHTVEYPTPSKFFGRLFGFGRSSKKEN
jgi:prephenate dehydrogenase